MPILRAYRRYRWVMVSGFPWRPPRRIGGERVRVFRHGHAELVRLGAASLESLAEQLTGEQVQREQAAVACLGWFFDAGALLDDVVGGDPDLLVGEVEPVFPQGGYFAAPCSGGERGPQVEAELLVLGPDEIEQPRGLLGTGRVWLALARVRRPGVLGGVAVGPLVPDGEVQRGGDDRVDPQDRRRSHRLADVQAAPAVAGVRPGGAVVPERPAPLVAGVRTFGVVLGLREPAAKP